MKKSSSWSVRSPQTTTLWLPVDDGAPPPRLPRHQLHLHKIVEIKCEFEKQFKYFFKEYKKICFKQTFVWNGFKWNANHSKKNIEMMFKLTLS